MNPKNLKALFEPKSIAVVGASRRETSVGFAIFNNLISGKYTGKLYPVNPKVDQLINLKCYPTISDIPDQVDLDILIVPSGVTLKALEEAIAKGIKAAVIISAGFREVGEEGRKLEEKISELATKNNIALLGPNCLGFINTDPNYHVNASFAIEMPKEGNIAFISQSGALCTAILDFAKARNIGFSKFVSLGNKAHINELDILHYLKDDPNTDLILLYLEDIVDGESFIQVAREITGEIESPKPIIAIKSEKVVGALSVVDDDEIMMFTKKGQAVRSPIKDVRITGRAASGVRLVNLSDGKDALIGISKVIVGATVVAMGLIIGSTTLVQ